MNYRAWLTHLTKTMANWCERPGFQLRANTILPPASDVRSQAGVDCISSDLMEFYETAAASCDVNFLLTLNGESDFGLTTVGELEISTKIGGGFTCMSMRDALAAKEEMLDLLDSIPVIGEDQKKTAHSALAASLPIFCNDATEFLVIASRNPVWGDGVFWVEYSSIHDPSRAVKVASSLPDWLDFLEANAYLGESLSTFPYFPHEEGRGLKGNPTFCRNLMERF